MREFTRFIWVPRGCCCSYQASQLMAVSLLVGCHHTHADEYCIVVPRIVFKPWLGYSKSLIWLGEGLDLWPHAQLHVQWGQVPSEYINRFGMVLTCYDIGKAYMCSRKKVVCSFFFSISTTSRSVKPDYCNTVHLPCPYLLAIFHPIIQHLFGSLFPGYHIWSSPRNGL